MKKALILASTLFTLLQAKAQLAHFGIKGGLNASSLNYKGKSYYQNKIGFNAGLFAHIHTSNKFWALQPELYYSLEGNKPLLIPSGSGNNNLSFLNIPVLIQYLPGLRFRIEAGPR